MTTDEETNKDEAASDAHIQAALESFGVHLRDLRDSLGFNQADLAEELGVKRQTVSSWEQGTTSPDVKTLLKLKRLARGKDEVSLGALFGEERPDSGKTPLEYAVRLLKAIDETGIRGVYKSRAEALEAFLPFLEKEDRAISVVASSFMGVTRVASPHVSQLLRKKVSTVKFRILMTHPDVGSLREGQEKRRRDSIGLEIREALQLLHNDWKVEPKNIRFYRGAPTIFLLFTSNRMLVNPYTYQTEAFKTMTLEVARTPNPDDLYMQYSQNHFELPWNSQNSEEAEVSDT